MKVFLKRGWCLGGMALLLGFVSQASVRAQEAGIGSDALLGDAKTEVREEESEEEASDDESGKEEDQTERLTREVEQLREELRERSEELRDAMLQRQMDRAQRAEEEARRAMDEVNLAERLQGVLRAGQSKYWIGVQTSKLTEEQREKLNLEASVKGVVVESVVDESPAKAAGLQNGDVIQSIDGEPIEEVGELIAAVTKAEDKTIKLGIVRGMDRLNLEVTPAERPMAVEGFAFPGGMELQIDGQELLPPGIGNLGGVPAGMSIQIAREGEGPAKIKVEYQGETYEVTSESLEELPEEIREQVQGMVDGRGMEGLFPMVPGFEGVPGLQLRMGPMLIPGAEFPQPEEDLREEVKKLREEMNELREVIEELRKSIM